MLIVHDRRCFAHQAPLGYPETPDRIKTILAALAAAGADLLQAGQHAGAEAAIRDVHDPRYVERFGRATQRGDGLLDSADNPLSLGTWSAAWAAVEATLAASDAVAQGRTLHAFAAVRPPGHHAEKALAMGFCFFNNAAIAAQYLLSCHGANRVAVFDFDVHHGNGTQHIFEERADVLYASVHQHPFYPGTGAASERGRGPGLGTTVNVPLPAGTGDAEFLAAFDHEILPALTSFAPDVLILSAGLDAWQGDPLGGFKVTLEGFAALGSRIREAATVLCGGRTLSLLEGGYDIANLGCLASAYLGLSGAAGPGRAMDESL